jgi:hypothetical protein
MIRGLLSCIRRVLGKACVRLAPAPSHFTHRPRLGGDVKAFPAYTPLCLFSLVSASPLHITAACILCLPSLSISLSLQLPLERQLQLFFTLPGALHVI